MTGPRGPVPAEATILVVDDTPSARLTLVELLSGQGYRIVEASSGPAALALAREVLFDLVLLDVMMPGMDGFEVCRTMRADPVLATIPIVLVTALDDRASKLKGLEAGADDFLCKPVDSAELRARVRTIVRLNRFRRQLEERREAAEALARSESRFRALFENAASAVVVHDLDGRFLEVNRRACESLGHTRDELLAMNVADLDRDFDLPAAQAVWRQLGSVSSHVFTAVHRRRDGGTLVGEVHLSAIDLGGRPLVLSTTLDVTERVAATRALHALNAELEERVRQRTAELEVANRDLESFASSVSHDLRAPLRAIDGYCQVLQEDHAAALDAEGLRLFGVVRESTARMAHLITDLLSFARVGRTELHGCRVAMGELARSVWEEVAADAPRPDVELVLGDLPEAEGDPALLRQVFSNLLGNAVKYSSRAERPRVVVEAAAGEEFVTFSVSDNGVGFDPVEADRLFRAFQRLHSARDYPGTGIGLALVHRIVERHGGRVAARGEPGQGATFSFTLPAGPARTG